MYKKSVFKPMSLLKVFFFKWQNKFHLIFGHFKTLKNFNLNFKVRCYKV